MTETTYPPKATTPYIITAIMITILTILIVITIVTSKCLTYSNNAVKK